MYLAKVVGTAVATQKDSNLAGGKLLVVQVIGPRGEETTDLHVAVDTVGAGTDSIVVVVIGSGARLTEMTKPMPVDAAVVAIVESLEVEGERTYSAEAGFGQRRGADADRR